MQAAPSTLSAPTPSKKKADLPLQDVQRQQSFRPSQDLDNHQTSAQGEVKVSGGDNVPMKGAIN